MKQIVRRILPPSFRYRLFQLYLRATPIHEVRRWQLQRKVRSMAPPYKVLVGAGNTNFAGWIPTDEHTLNLLRQETWARYFAPNSIKAILAEHVWEHLTPVDGLRAAQNCFTFLKPGGYLRIAVPDGYHPDPQYIDSVKPGGSGAAADDHKILYTYQSLSDMLRQAGFQPRLLEYFDENGAFHFEEWESSDGYIQRSSRNDRRNQDGVLRYTSLLIDAQKPKNT